MTLTTYVRTLVKNANDSNKDVLTTLLNQPNFMSVLRYHWDRSVVARSYILQCQGDICKLLEREEHDTELVDRYEQYLRALFEQMRDAEQRIPATHKAGTRVSCAAAREVLDANAIRTLAILSTSSRELEQAIQSLFKVAASRFWQDHGIVIVGA